MQRSFMFFKRIYYHYLFNLQDSYASAEGEDESDDEADDESEQENMDE